MKSTYTIQFGLMATALLMTLVPPVQLTAETDPHAHHRAMMQNAGSYQRSIEHYNIPDLTLINADGKPVRIQDAINLDEPLMVNFIFTTCPSICPVMSATFAQTKKQLGPVHDDIHFLSISIDPEFDTPEKLTAYAKKFNAGPEWQFLTGSLEDSIAMQRAFNAYRGEKMNHAPLTLLRASKNTAWVRVDGLATASDLVDEYHLLFTDESLVNNH